MPRKSERRAPIAKERIEKREDLICGYKSRFDTYEAIFKKATDKINKLKTLTDKEEKARCKAKIEELKAVLERMKKTYSKTELAQLKELEKRIVSRR